MRLKVQYNKENHIISVDDSSKLSELIKKLKSDGILKSDTNVNIKVGFPPKPVDLMDLETELLDVGIRPGDKVLVEDAAISEKSTQTNPTDEFPPYTDQQQQQQQQQQLNVAQSASNAVHIKLDDGFLVLRKIPDDNSCLFRSISYAYFNNLEEGSQLRSIVADFIRNDSTGTYNEAILGKPVKEYTKWIQQPTSWGGAIELQILSKHLNVNIYSLDVESGRLDTFGDENSSFENLIIVIYSGIHYDTIAFTPLNNIDDQSLDITVFQKNTPLSNDVLTGVKTLRKKLNHKGYVTNTSSFKIQCKVCNKILQGERQASEHASTTQHYQFGEVN